MKNISCCFTGHRVISPENSVQVMKELSQVLQQCYDDGYRIFYAGGALGFDTLAEKAVIEFREDHPDVKLIIVIPCENQANNWKRSDKAEYMQLIDKADEVICLSKFYYNGCMQVRNRHMVNNSSLCVAYLTKNGGGSAYTVDYARKCGLQIINIADLLQISN